MLGGYFSFILRHFAVVVFQGNFNLREKQGRKIINFEKTMRGSLPYGVQN